VGIFDWLPLIGASIGATVVVIAALFHSATAGIWMLGFFLIYQQLENHFLQPLVQGRTVKMSPLLVLVSVLVGIGLGGILGAIVAIPVGASVQILVRDYMSRRLPTT
jgi:predicted PurR-regulated permease PerM